MHIDEEKCDGCGLCAPNCAEGAIQIINGKAKLVADNLCDGLGACLGHCPRGAITVEQRPADDFDHDAVKRHLAATQTKSNPLSQSPPAPAAHAGGCPGSRMRMMRPAAMASAPAADASTPSQSRLSHWPVQLALVPPQGPMWQDADVLIAADCVPFAYPDFHEKLLAGRSIAIACPKLDDIGPYVQKLAMIFAANNIKSITVAHMEVPCCRGIVRLVHEALVLAGREDIPVNDATIGVDGARCN